MRKEVKLGFRENWQQFVVLVIINAFVGGMVGLERSILPRIAEAEFQIAAKAAILSFIVVFGTVKAITNYFTGTLAHRLGRKNLLVAGWVLALPVPLMLMYAGTWNWIVAANVLLGMSQGLTWSSTVAMKIDLVGDRQRGLAMGVNEFAGYIAVALVAFSTGWIAAAYGVRPYPFYIGIVLSVLGLLGSWLFVKDTRHHVMQEAAVSNIPRLRHVFHDTTWRNKNLSAVTQAGLVNNLNDGMMWGIFPILLASKGFTLAEIGLVTAIYPAVWGIAQLFTGRMADHFCKKDLLFIGMFMQGIALLGLLFAVTLFHFVGLSVLLGLGTAIVYPTFLATIAENVHPADRAKSLGVFRFWRDLGYAIGAILTGIIADAFGLNAAIVGIGLLTIGSAVLVVKRMHCLNNDAVKIWHWLTHQRRKEQPACESSRTNAMALAT